MREVVSANMEVGNKELTIEGFVLYHVEKKYGADADGNRGEIRTIIDDVFSIMAYDLDFNDVNLCQNDQERAAEILGRKFMEE